ncbi:GTPase [Azotobacter chroococcum]|nr:GTPase [Azotobacter chroococcum]
MSIGQQTGDEFDKQIADITKANLMVVGGTGVGKSSLINRVFGEELAKTGAGAPVTRGCEKYEREHVPVVIFDTEGYEIVDGGVDNSNFQQSVIKEIERRESLELKEQIHLYWYCISASNHRITDYDIDNIKALSLRHAELAIVITQCDNEEVNEQNEGLTSLAFRKILKEAAIKNEVFETAATLDEKLQLDELIEWSANSLSNEKLKDAFIGAQLNNLELKDKQASTAILYASGAAAAAAGINPIPMSDSLAIVPIQMALAARLAQIYGFNALERFRPD